MNKPMNRSEFEARLNEAYDGAVKPLNDYVNKQAVLCFKCEKCGLRFFARPSHMVGKKHQRHECGMPCGDNNGERLSAVSSRHKARKQKGSSPKETAKLLNEMIWEDYTYQQIAKKLQVNPNIIRDYFKDEGLI